MATAEAERSQEKMMFQHMRIARPVTRLDKSCEMYCAGLGLEKTGEFFDHAGFSGCMLGRKDLPWHLEFTLCPDHPILPSPSAEDLLVFYFPEVAQWQAVCSDMERAGFARVKACNPYWDNKGVTFVDRDGYRVVIQNMLWQV